MYDKIFPEGLPVSPIKQIKSLNLPVYLYGMGNGAEKMYIVCEDHGIKLSGVFASDGFKAGKQFLGFAVKSLSEVAADNPNGFVALVCFGCKTPDMRTYLGKVRKAGGKVFMPHLPLFGGDLFTSEHYVSNYDKIEKAYYLLSDDKSKALYKDILKYCLTWDPEVLFLGETNSYAFPDFFSDKKIVTAIDGGAYRGDTALSLSRDLPTIKSILAFEPDSANFAKLKEVRIVGVDITCLDEGLYEKNDVLHFAALKNRGSHFCDEGIEVKVTSVDCAVSEKIDLIKLDVEGCEYSAIIGAKNTILRDKPALYVSLYHKTDDIYEIPLLINELCPGYQFAMFRADVCPAWDIILLAK